MEFALTQTLVKALRELKERHPNEKPLGLKLEIEDLDVFERQITPEFCQHAETILGVKTDETVKDEDPAKFKSEVHEKLAADAKRFSQHSLENVIVNFLIIPLLIGSAIHFGCLLFP